MTKGDILMLRQKDLLRLHIIRQIREKTLKQNEAAELLKLSSRQVRRLLKRVINEGEAGIQHKLRGISSNKKISQELKGQIIGLYRERYFDFGPTFASEKLSELDNISINRETLRSLLIESGDWKKCRKRKAHRQWRERKPCLGIMVLIDGSHHDWFEDRGPKAVFMGYIDDATGNIFGRFYEYEGTIPFMDSFKRYIKKYGTPISVYVDKHSTYKSTGKPTLEDELNGIEPLSEVERALKELGVEVIHANSPEAKGRVERLFKTLQDRLVKEMRLREISSIGPANLFLDEYLPKYNKKFSVIPARPENMHRTVPPGLNLDSILCIKEERVLRNDWTISYNGKLYQVLDKVHAKRVTLETRIKGNLLITYKGSRLKYKEIMSLPKKLEQPIKSAPAARKAYIPPSNHPWRSFRYGRLDKKQKSCLQKEAIGALS